jgi:hypothetical protein
MREFALETTPDNEGDQTRNTTATTVPGRTASSPMEQILQPFDFKLEQKVRVVCITPLDLWVLQFASPCMVR